MSIEIPQPPSSPYPKDSWNLFQEEALGYLQKKAQEPQRYSLIFAEPAIYTDWDVSWRLPEDWDTQTTSKEQQWKDWTRQWLELTVSLLDEDGILYLGLQQGIPENPENEIFPDGIDTFIMHWLYMTPELSSIEPVLVSGVGNIHCIRKQGSKEFPRYSNIERENGIPTLRYPFGVESFLCRQGENPKIHVCPENIFVDTRDRVTMRVRKPVAKYANIIQGHLENRSAQKALCLFAGSGSEMVACLQNGIPCDGVEYDAEHAEYIRTRLLGSPPDIEKQYLELDPSRDWFAAKGTTPELIAKFRQEYGSILEEI